jgi:putative transposase
MPVWRRLWLSAVWSKPRNPFGRLMKIQRALKTRLDLTPTQREVLARHGGAARFVYNWGLEQRQTAYQTTGQGLTYPQQNLTLTQLKAQQPWLYKLSKWVGQTALRNLDTAFANFFRDAKKHRSRKAGFPQFKCKAKQRDSFSFPGWSGTRQLVQVQGDRVKLPVIGWLRAHETLARPGKLLSAAVSQDGEYWNISLCYEFEHEAPLHPGPAVGVDLGVKTLAVLSDGKTLANPKHLKQAQTQLRRWQRWLSRQQQGSGHWEQAKQRVARCHRRVRNQRQDALHKLTTHLAQTYSLICIEDLNVAGLTKNHSLAQSISDVAFGELRRQLEYKAPYWGGMVTVVVRYFPSSKMCSACGVVNQELTLDTRHWRCDCGAAHDRDHNAAQNLLAAGLAVFARRPGSSGLAHSASETTSNEAGTDPVRTFAH